MTNPTVLRSIVDRKHEEVAMRESITSGAEMRARCNDISECRGFVDAIRKKTDAGEPAVIAEIKKASPSKGVIREHFEPSMLARSYADGRAACLSVLTDQDFFQGSDKFLREARNACDLPVLRKDFTIDAYQVYEARVIGADCVLLIAAILEQALMNDLNSLALEIGLDVLIEVHNAQELEMAANLEPALLGINNRDLHNFETSLQTTIDLMSRVPGNSIVISESGIHTAEDVELLRSHGVTSFLVGEAFMRADEPGEKLKELFYR